MARHIALLGDSTLDNRAYTHGEPDVVQHLTRILPSPWRATLYAVDGSTTSDIRSQAAQVSADVSHVVLSVGGNDALMNSDLLALVVRSTTEALALFADRVSRFEAGYQTAVDAAVAIGRPSTVCTIYNGNLEEPRARIARIALMTFNDSILRVAFAAGLGVIDLRSVCSTPEDYANPIEPSGTGGRKIAGAIARAVGAIDPGVRFARVFT
jgi:queuine/archaeosine tRNA-ribosyltransferase